LGRGWRHSFERSIYAKTWVNGTTKSGTAFARRPDGKSYTYKLQTDGTWKTDADVVERLQQQVDGTGATLGWSLVTRDDETEIYDANGRPSSITYLGAQSLTFAYSDASTPPSAAPAPGYLLNVSDTLGRTVAFAYDGSGHLVQFSDTAGQQYQYAYDANNRLTSVTYPDGSQRGYLYNEPAYTPSDQPYTLTGIVDENASRFATFTYDNQGRAIASEHAGGVGRVSLSFRPNMVTSVTDALGTSRDLSFSNTLLTYKVTAATQPCASCGSGVTKAIGYDANGNVSSRTDFNYVATLYQYDLTRNLETSRTEANGWPQQRIITTQWHPTFRLPTQITEPAPGGTKTTTLTYDSSRNLRQKSITAAKNDGTSGTITRTWTWTFQTLGRIATATDPDGHLTAYAYYPDTDSDLGRRGNVATITNAVGHITQVASYDLAGRPLKIIDPNGLTTTLTYDPRGRLTTRQVGTETTSYAYDAAGQLIKVTLPDASYLQYTYDAAHRLRPGSGK
jgi:YD repeat-containing protein